MSAKNHTKLSVIQRESLDRMIIDPIVSQQVVARCKIILLAAEGLSDEAISRDIGVHRHTCRRCRQIFAQTGLEGLWHVAAGRGRKKSYDLHNQLVKMRKQTRNPAGKYWSTRPIAKAHKVHASTVARILIQYRLPNSRSGEDYSMSQVIVPKCIEVVGAYLTQKERFLALLEYNSVPKPLPKSLKNKSGRIPRISNKNTRHFSATLVAALKAAQDFVAKCSMSQRHSWSLLDFAIRLGKANVGKHIKLHIVSDKTVDSTPHDARDWLARRPRFILHNTAIDSNWLNTIEQCIAELIRAPIQRGSFTKVPDLISRINKFTAQGNPSQQPLHFYWLPTKIN